ncbi:HTH-type transcriptional regulator/antitoxin HipB [Bradyrhizobium sp. USDA 4472]
MALTTTAELGELIRNRRTSLGLRQQDLALAARVGVRFIVDIENGKETSQVGLVLRLLQALGIRLMPEMSPAPSARPTAEPSEAFDPDNFSTSP